MTLLFLRHAATDLAGTFCGHTDPPLNVTGRAQLPVILERLSTQPIEVIYTSDLLRAAETAQALATARAVPCHTLPALREIHFGAWEALTWAQIEQADPLQAQLWVDQFPNLPTPSGETFAAFRQRVTEVVTNLLARTDHRHAAVVTHAGVMRLVLEDICHLTPQEAHEITRPYGSSFQLPYSGSHA